jgi:uncharacterized Tic20 family protein
MVWAQDVSRSTGRHPSTSTPLVAYPNSKGLRIVNPFTANNIVIMNPLSATAALDPTNRLPLRIEAAPAFGLGTMSTEQERIFVLLAHLFPLIIWPWKRNASPAVDAHGKEALNLGITLLLVMFPLGIITGIIGSTTLALLVSLATSLASLAVLVLVVIGALKAQSGLLLRYPGNLRLVK